MPKIVRYDGNLKAFASEQLTNERTLFGEVAIANDLTSQITAQFLRGWGIIGPSDQPSLQDFNAAMYTHGQLLAYLHQMGVAEYNSAQEYFVGSLTQIGGALYISLANANIGNSPSTSPAQWKAFATDQATELALGLVKIATQALVIAGTDDQTAVTPKKRAIAAQTQSNVAFPTTGTATAQVLTPIPAIQSYSTSQRFNVTFNVASGTNPTINVSGQGVKFLKQYDSSGLKIAASFAAGQIADIVYDGTDFMVISSMSGFTGLKYKAMYYFSTSSSVNFNTHSGSIIIGLSNTAINAQLPPANTFPEASTVTFFNYFSGPMTIVCAGSDGIVASDTTSTMVLTKGMSVTLVSNNGTSWFAVGLAAGMSGVSGSASKLIGSATGTNPIVSYTMDEITLKSSAGTYQTVSNVSISVNLSSTGTNGVDVGVSAPNTWYSIWVVLNPGDGVYGIASLSATSPSLAAGQFKALVGWLRTDSTANKFPLGFTQAGKRSSYSVTAGTNLVAFPAISTGVGGSFAAGGLVPVALSGFAPPGATAIEVAVFNTGGLTIVATSNNFGANNDVANPPPVQCNPAGGAYSASTTAMLAIKGASVFWSAAGSQSRVSAMGWENNL